MARCFVMQPFDGGPFDKRYVDVIAPAIIASGLEPYRVDQDPAASVPIESIESGIRESAACVADITEDNPNVWFELGFAIACRKEVVLLCDRTRKARFPFDIQHRQVTTYARESIRDFTALQRAITDRLTAALKKHTQLRAIAAAGPVADTEGLSPQEMVALVVVMTGSMDIEEIPSAHGIQSDMEKAGYTRIAAALSIRSLARKGYVGHRQVSVFNSGDYTGYFVTPPGEDWLLANQDKLILKHSPKGTRSGPSDSFVDFPDFPEDDSTPF